MGIAPSGFEDPLLGAVDAWVPYDLVSNTSEQNYSVSVVGRLRNGVTVERLQGELATPSRAMAERWPAARSSAVVAVPLRDDLVAAVRGPLLLVLIAVAFVLVVACANVANLMLVRATGRVHEFAVRSALGSGRRRLVGQLLVENALLAALGGVTGLTLAAGGVEILRGLGRGAIPRLDEVGYDPTVLAFAAAITAATALVFGMAPAQRLAWIPPSDALCQRSRATTGTRGLRWVRSGLAAAQLALALTLLVGAGVLGASFQRLSRVDLGFRVDRVLTFEVNLPAIRYDAEDRAAFQEELARRLQGSPA